MQNMSHEATELALYIENTRGVWEGYAEPVRANLKRKVQRGYFDRDLSERAWKRVADQAAKIYRLEHCSIAEKWYNVFPISARREVASYLADSFEIDYLNGEV